MQIVIEINKETYSDIMYRAKNTPRNMDDYDWLIAKGTPLPEKHGRIIDESKIILPLFESETDEKWVKIGINNAPTIIEADTEK